MSHHIDVADSGPIILEGGGVFPRLRSLEYLKRTDSWFIRAPSNAVKALFLVEDDVEQLRVNMYVRKRGSGNEPDQQVESRAQIAQGAWNFGQYLKSEARDYSIPVILARPFDTLSLRAARAVGIDTVES